MAKNLALTSVEIPILSHVRYKKKTPEIIEISGVKKKEGKDFFSFVLLQLQPLNFELEPILHSYSRVLVQLCRCGWTV